MFSDSFRFHRSFMHLFFCEIIFHALFTLFFTRNIQQNVARIQKYLSKFKYRNLFSSSFCYLLFGQRPTLECTWFWHLSCCYFEKRKKKTNQNHQLGTDFDTQNIFYDFSHCIPLYWISSLICYVARSRALHFYAIFEILINYLKHVRTLPFLLTLSNGMANKIIWWMFYMFVCRGGFQSFLLFSALLFHSNGIFAMQTQWIHYTMKHEHIKCVRYINRWFLWLFHVGARASTSTFFLQNIQFFGEPKWIRVFGSFWIYIPWCCYYFVVVLQCVHM